MIDNFSQLLFQVNYNDQLMQTIISLFRDRNIFEDITQKSLLNHKQVPPPLYQLIQTHIPQFVKFINAHNQQNINHIQKITLVHLLLIHHGELFEPFQDIQLNLSVADEWMRINILNPYQHYLRKMILSVDTYHKIRIINLGWNGDLAPFNEFHCKDIMRDDPKSFFNLQIIYFCFNMLNDLFAFLKKIPHLGRYYSKDHASYLSPLSIIASFQVTLYYFAFKFVIGELLTKSHLYLKNDEEIIFLKEILTKNLQKINEELKALFLNKYFNPIQKGIKTTLFELDRQRPQLKNSLVQLGIVQREVMKNSKKNRKYLKKRIFQNGSFDSDVFQKSILMVSSSAYLSEDLEAIEDKENTNNINYSHIEGKNIKGSYNNGNILQEMESNSYFN